MKQLAPFALALGLLLAFSLRQPAAQSAPEIPINTLEDLGKLEKKIQEVVAKTRAAVVGIRMGGSSGSGSFISADGWVCSCGHVTETKPGTKCTVIAYGGESFDGVVYGSDMAMDYGVIKVDTKGKKVAFVELGDSDKVKNGQWLIAMGHPLGVEKNRDGVVRAGRVLAAKNRQGFITMDAPVIHGDSGGPVVDLGGKQVAINQSINGLDSRVNNVTPVALFKKQLDEMKANKVLHPVQGQPRFGRGIQSDGLTDAEREAYGRAMELHGRENYAEAAKLVEAFTNKKNLDPGVLYNLACIYAKLASGKQGKDGEELQKKAVELLARSIEAGWDDVEHTRKDTDLDCLRKRKDYQAAEDLCAKAQVKPVFGLVVRSSSGMRVSEVIPGSPADRAGLKKEDIIQKIGKAKIAGAQEYLDLLLFEGLPAETDFTVSRRKEKPGAIKMTLPAFGAKVISSGGAQVREVAEDSIAYKAGIKVGDVVIKVGTTKIKTALDFANALFCADSRRPTVLTYKRGYETETLEFTFAASDTGGATASIFKQAESLLKLWDKLGEKYVDAIFSVKQKGKQVAFATAVDTRGYLLTKASEIDPADKIVLVARDGKQIEATLVATDSKTDLALIKVPGSLAAVVKFEVPSTGDKFPAIGLLLGTLDEKGRVIAHGIVALPPYDSDANARPLPDDAVMGVGISDSKDGGALVDAVTAGGPADKGGLKKGDLIKKIDGTELAGRDDFMTLMRNKEPGNTLDMEVLRDGKVQKLSVVLGARKDLPGGGGAGPAPTQKGTGKPDLGVAAGSPANPGLKVEGVRDGTPAELAGIVEGDVILEANATPINSLKELAALIDALKPGDKVAFKLTREGKPLALEIELAEMEAPPPSGAGTQNKGPINARCDKLGSVIQHDALLAPRQMGGPVIDLKGNVIGFNIARSDRTRNFAIPATRVVEALAKLLKLAEGK